MKKIIYIFIISLFFQQNIYGQNSKEKTVRKTIFIEAGGFGGYGSVNFEYLIKTINKIKYATRIGLSTYHIYDYTNTFNPDLQIPLALNIYYGLNHNIDFSIGQSYASIIQAQETDFSSKRKNTFSTILSLGYRYQKAEGGFMFKISYAPIIEENKRFRNWFLLDLGYAF